MSFPNFPDCPTCGKSTPSANVPAGYGPQVQIPCFSSANLPCDSNAGKFYDVFQVDFVVPLAGNSVEVSVCDPSLWAGCQWIGACYPNAGNLIAIFKIVSVDVNANKIIIYNGCKDGTAISDNPAPGTKIAAGSVFYPMPPPSCATEECNKIREIIASGDCACQGVLDCIAASKDICFTSVKDLGENEEVHFFGGTKPTTVGDNFYKSCIRKLKKVFSSFAGTTVCMPDGPAYQVENANKIALFDENGCLRKGPAFQGSNCNDEQNVNDGVLTTIKGCKSGVEAAVKPTAANTAMMSCQDDNNNKFWKEGRIGLSFFPIFNQTVYTANGGPRVIDHILDADIPPKFCNRQRYAQFLVQITGCSATNQSIAGSVTINGALAIITYYGQECRTAASQAMVPVDDNNPKSFNVQISGIGNVALIFMGYWA